MDDFQFTFERRKISKIPRAEMIKELKWVAEFYNFVRFTRHDFDKVARTCKGSAVLAEFGSWQKAIDSIGVKLKPKQVNRSLISQKELFDELGRVWKLLGHRPSKTEWDLIKPKYSYTTYKQRFGSWTNACLKFIENKMDKTVFVEDTKPKESELLSLEKVDTNNQEIKREIPLKIRLKVLQRDNLRCVLCGNSPAINLGTVLHIDHILPYSKGGKTTSDNLRTLCVKCNWGKGDDEKF